MATDNSLDLKTLRVIEYSLLHPYSGKDAVCRAINSENVFSVSASGVANICKAWDIETYSKRIQASISISKQRNPIADGLVEKITKNDIDRNSELFKPGFNKSGLFQLHCTFPGQWGIHDVLACETDFGLLFQQTFIDAYTLMAFAKVHYERTAAVAEKFIANNVIPFYHANGLRIEHFYIANSNRFVDDDEYCNYLDFFQKIGYKDKDYIPAAKKRKDDNLLFSFIKKISSSFYSNLNDVKSLDVLQKKLDKWIYMYNDTSNIRRYCYGKTPNQTFADSKHLYPS